MNKKVDKNEIEMDFSNFFNDDIRISGSELFSRFIIQKLKELGMDIPSGKITRQQYKRILLSYYNLRNDLEVKLKNTESLYSLRSRVEDNNQTQEKDSGETSQSEIPSIGKVKEEELTS